MKHEQYRIGDEVITIPVAESYRDCLTLFKSDNYRYMGRIESTWRCLRHAFRPFYPSVLFWFRMVQYKAGRWAWLCRFFYKRACEKSLIDLPAEVKAGYGLCLGHNMCIVVHPKTIIGNNSIVSQFVNIGSTTDTPAIIGNEVYIGPHVCLVDHVEIGSGATIGAGAVVLSDVPAGATAVGVPARVVNYNRKGLITYRYPIAEDGGQK